MERGIVRMRVAFVCHDLLRFSLRSGDLSTFLLSSFFSSLPRHQVRGSRDDSAEAGRRAGGRAGGRAAATSTASSSLAIGCVGWLLNSVSLV